LNKKWWHGKVAYQVYPKSFNDTTGSGIGDINGVREKLDYLKKLGVDIIWLSPCYVSPLADEGYDIADYYKIDPRFGTNDDLWKLVAEAGKRDMHIVMDLVINHCSDEHEWFKKALADPEGEYAKYFFLKMLLMDTSLITGAPILEEVHGRRFPELISIIYIFFIRSSLTLTGRTWSFVKKSIR